MTSEDVLNFLNQRACALLKSSSAVDTKQFEYSGLNYSTNKFVGSLLADVPEDMYNPDKVYSVSINGKVEFAAWLFTFFGTKAFNIYAKNYNDINDEDFPRQEFTRQRRQIKNCGYQKRSRAKVCCSKQ